MIKTTLIITLLLITINCKGQEIKKGAHNTTKTDTMKYFDKDKYLKNKGVNGYEFTLNNGQIYVRQMEHEDGTFTQEYIENNTPYENNKEFYKKTSLKKETNLFYRTIVGIVREYDENGKIIKETDYDKDYKFSIEDLSKKMKDEYKVDILNTKQTRSVNRNNNKYLVICDQQARNTFYNYVIDGTTGETLSIKIIDGESEYEKVILDRKAEKKKTEEDDNIYFTTYKGKDYTKGEWKAFEEEWYKNHQDKKNSKGFWDDIFKRP